MKKSIYLFSICAIGLMITISATGALQTTQLETQSLDKQSEYLQKAEEIPIKLDLKTQTKNIQTLTVGTDSQITQNTEDDQNPSVFLSADNIFMGFEIETDSDFDLGLFSSDIGGTTWTDNGGYILEGSPTQPRFDLAEGNSAHATILSDQWAENGMAYHIELPDINEPGDWIVYTTDWGSQEYGPFTSCDIASYTGELKPTEEFWGILTITGDSGWGYYNDWMVQWTDADSSWITRIGSTTTDYFNASCDIDPSNGDIIVAAEYVANNDASNNGIRVQVGTLTTGDNWQNGIRLIKQYKKCSHPYAEAENGKVYIIAEIEADDGSKDIVCYSSNDPLTSGSWEKHMITETPGTNEMYPSVVVYGDGATCSFIQNGDLYTTSTVDAGATWSTPEKVNDETGTVVEQYGSADITTSGHILWTDNRNGNNDIYYDNVGMPSVAIVDIGEISGGIGISADIENSGTAAANNVQWSIDVEGGLILAGKHAEGTISTLAAEDSETVKIPFVLGLGAMTITVAADGKTKDGSGTVLLIFTTID